MADVANLTIGAAALLLGVSVDTVRRWSDDGRLPVTVLPSGHRRYRRSDIDALLAKGAA
jgi:excisionase family DNA binding protein